MDQNAKAGLWMAGDGGEADGESRTVWLAPGTSVAGKYIICDVLGTGGAAVVYAAEQLGLKRVVAFKHYPACGVAAAALLSRFEREAQLLARVHHENVVGVFDAGSMADGSPYLVVQRLSGDSLATHLLAGPLSVREAVGITRQVLSALCALSDADIVHGDIKPGNIVLHPDAAGQTVAKLVDFGIARDLRVPSSPVREGLVGTPRYMAPEQVRGEPIDARCDLYALGVTLYEMLTGRTPHDGATAREIVRSTLFGPITPVEVLREDCPDGLAQVVMKALARDPRARFESAREMESALEGWPASPVASGHSKPVVDPEANEDTLRVRLPRAIPARTRGRMRTMAAVACAGMLGALVLAHEGSSRSLATQMTEHLTAAQTWPSASAERVLRGVTSSACQLLSRAHAAMIALVERPSQAKTGAGH